MYDDVFLNEYGFYTLKTLPTDVEIESFYRDRYYQESLNSSYQTTYTNEELTFFEAKLQQKLLLIEQHIILPTDKTHSFLDIGCGEGFAVAFFKKKGFSVLGLDYSIDGIKKQNPEIENDVMFGDIYDNIEILLNSGRQFDIVNMDNVLEHVMDPKILLQKIYNVLSDNGVLFVKVPNDFSYLQEYFYKHGIIDNPYWVAPIEHISYFNKDGLINVCAASGFRCVDSLSDMQVEFFLLNPSTNYIRDKVVAKSRTCHFARIAQENIFHEISPEKTIELYRVLGSMGVGRQIIGIFKKIQSNK